MFLHQPAGRSLGSIALAGFLQLHLQLRRPWVQKHVFVQREVMGTPSGFQSSPPAASRVTPSHPPPTPHSDVQLNIHNYGELRNSSNVMGIIRGSVEPGEARSALSHIPDPSKTPSQPPSLPPCRQVRDLRQPQGQLGARRHRPKQRDVGDAGAEQSVGQEGQAG